MASLNVELLAKRIKDEFDIDVDPEKFYRTYVGKHQRAAGECGYKN